MNKKNNNGIFYVVISLVAVLGIAGLIRAYSSNSVEAPGIVAEGNITFNGDYINNAATQDFPSEVTLGGFPGPDIYQDINIHGTVTSGGNGRFPNSTSTISTTYTLVGNDLTGRSYIDFTPNTGATTLTLPATSTMIALLPEIGSSRTWTIKNATTTAEQSLQTLTFAAGTGMDFVSASSTASTLAPGSYADITCKQIPYITADNENIVCEVDAKSAL